jgi:hypothetical protein
MNFQYIFHGNQITKELGNQLRVTLKQLIDLAE